MASQPIKVLISGAGIAGPCLAFWLTKSKTPFDITILERSPVPRVTGQSIDVRGAAIDIIKKMRLEEQIRACGTTEVGTTILNSSNKTVAYFPGGKSFTAEYEILRADLANIFLKATENIDNMQYKYGDYIRSLDNVNDRTVVTFNSGHEETYDLVVAADGSQSKTRAMFLDEKTLEGSYNFIGQYIAFYSIATESHDNKMWRWYNAPKGLSIMMRPHRNPDTQGVYLCITTPKHGIRDPVVEDAMDKGHEATKDMLHEYFEDAGWEAKRVLKGLEHTEDFYMSKAAQVKLPKWHGERGVAIGDAAFATFGVGTSLAIMSAYTLAGELSKIQTGKDIPQALQRYGDVFRPIYKTMEELPPGYPQLAFPQTRWGIGIRDSLLWFMSKTKIYKLLPDDDATQKLPEYEWVEF